MSSRLQFSPAFARQMVFLSVLVGITISFLMPLTYFFTSWHKFSEEARIRGEDIAWKLQPVIQDNSSLWYYSVPKFLDSAGQEKIRAIIVYDQYSNVKLNKTINDKISAAHPFRTPVRYNNEICGFIEIYESTAAIAFETFCVTAIFLLIGTGIGAFLYWYPVHIVRLVEKDVQDYAEQAKRQAETEVARLDRLKLVGQMAAGIGHEVRNPLTTVRGYLQLFSRRADMLPVSSQIQLMIEELDRANGIITEFLSLAHNRTVTMERKNLNHIIEALQPLIHSDGVIHGINVSYDLQTVPDIILDEKKIRQLILNITRNGFEAMVPGKCLFIRTAVEANKVVLSVIDQGEGIDPACMPKLGIPFFTTKEAGTGLGLAVCYSIAHRHGTTIQFLSGDTGTVCRIPFPIPGPV
ncbi:MAG TPA: ATP-binding protein [Patescibacteria group bacterium]|nr:ATP-binding protein [Patescibacteria group bacterium]